MALPNALTIDVEDWYHVCGLQSPPVVAPSHRRVRQAVDLVLEILATFRVKATFFVLGCVAEEEPQMVPALVGEGHEVASHGWSHRLVYDLRPEEFRDEVRRTGDILAEQGGRRPIGFRAPQWSLSEARTPWAFSILREEGYIYDSSLNPLPLIGDRGGSRTPFAIPTPFGPLLELPPLVLPTPLGNMPVGGGWGFRFFPLRMVRYAMNFVTREGGRAVLYLHPREVDPESPRLPLPFLKSFASYGPRTTATKRLELLLGELSFTTLESMVQQCRFV